MIRKLATVVLCGVLILTVVPAAADNAQGYWACPLGFEGQTLQVYNWTTYIAEDTISDFEQLCGVSVNYNTYASDTDMMDCLEQKTCIYDVVVPTDSTVYLLVADGLLQPLDLNQIPNFANVSENLKNPPYDPGNVYTVPYQWGTVGIGYNKTKVGHTITSWNDMFNYSGGTIAWLDDNRAMYGIVLKMLGFDPNTSDAAQVAQAEQFLASHAANMSVIAPDDGQDRLFKGEVDMVVEYSGDIFQIISDCKCDDFAYVIPKEGGRVWVDNLAIPALAQHKALAQTFIDYVLDAQVGADISNFTAYASPNQAAINAGLIDEDYLTNAAIYPDANTLRNLFFVKSDPTLAPIYDQSWEQLKTTLGPKGVIPS
jgi:spermidine/putrescine transport system substrate-binding protein